MSVKFVGCVFSTVLVAACANGENQTLSTGLGAVVGGIAGSQVGSGKGRIVAGVAGAVIGGLVGNRVGKLLDDRGRQQAADATVKTAQTGQTQQFLTSTGATVTTAPAPALAPAPPAKTQTSPPAAPQTAARECKTVRQTVQLQDGTRESEDTTLCNGPDGWQPA